MNNIVILIVSMIILLIIFIVTLVIISKNKINEIYESINIANDDINSSLKQKYALYKEIINYIKDNLSIKEDAFENFLEFKRGECTKSEIIQMLDKTTYEINEYVDNYDELLKNKEFKSLKKKLYYVQINLESVVEYYNNKLVLYEDLKTHGPTSIASKLFDFEDFGNIEIDKKEISRLINLN
ncbi:MAG: LemA family protein [Bacilli bacterium]|nr:LemA family protein [Bacilli bacterium]